MTTDAAVYPVREGGTATVAVTVATTGSAPLDEPVTVAYTTTGGTADPGRGLHAGHRNAHLPGRHRLGRDADRQGPHPPGQGRAEPAETIPLKLTVTGAKAPAETPQVVIDAHGLPYLDRKLPVRKRVADLLSRMSLEEKAGQMTQAERGAVRERGRRRRRTSSARCSPAAAPHPRPTPRRPGRR